MLTYAEGGRHPSSIAVILGVSTAQVEAALDYFAENREDLLKDYRVILARIARGNPPEVEAKSQRLAEKVAETRAKGDSSLLAKMWVYSGLHLARYNIFDFRVSRHRDGPDDFFRNSRCTVQGDCFSGNLSVVIHSDERLTFAACWGHARRKVVEATADSPGNASKRRSRKRRLSMEST